jgi:hypothetical protein
MARACVGRWNSGVWRGSLSFSCLLFHRLIGLGISAFSGRENTLALRYIFRLPKMDKNGFLGSTDLVSDKWLDKCLVVPPQKLRAYRQMTELSCFPCARAPGARHWDTQYVIYHVSQGKRDIQAPI